VSPDLARACGRRCAPESSGTGCSATKSTVAIVVLLLGGGSRGGVNEARAAGVDSPAQPAPSRYEFSDNWDGSPCIPRGQPATIAGFINVSPFGKGSDGARIVGDDGASSVVSYNAGPRLRGLDGKRVGAPGRVCDKQNEAIAGAHFDLESVTVK